jgi:hypothetical protein
VTEHVFLPKCCTITLPFASAHVRDVRNSSGYVSEITYILTYTHVLVTG